MHGWETGASGRVETKKKKKRKTEKKNWFLNTQLDKAIKYAW